MARFQKWREQKAPMLKEMGLTDEQVDKVLDFLIEELEKSASDAHWRDWDFGD